MYLLFFALIYESNFYYKKHAYFFFLNNTNLNTKVCRAISRDLLKEKKKCKFFKKIVCLYAKKNKNIYKLISILYNLTSSNRQ